MSLNFNINKSIENFESLFFKLNQNNAHPYDITMSNNKGILTFIFNNSLIVPEHPHPLLRCFTPERKQKFQYWICKECQCKYFYNVSSYYCTFCDYDMCQRCMLLHPVYKVQMYFYNNEKFKMNNNININNVNYRPFIHEHVMALIQMENFNSNIKCMKCQKNIQNIEHFYYCSLCNFFICKECFNKNEISQISQISQMSQDSDIYLKFDQLEEGNNKQILQPSQNNINNNDYLSGYQLPEQNNNLNNLNPNPNANKKDDPYLSNYQLQDSVFIQQNQNQNQNELEDSYIMGNQIIKKNSVDNNQSNQNNKNKIKDYFTGQELVNNWGNYN